MSVAQARAWAPGKLILAGEHAVVYGHPAIALAVRRGTWVRATRRPGPSGVDSSWLLADEGARVAFPADPRLGPALAAVLPPADVGLSVEADLPTGRGMGSSASLAVATVRALARLHGEEPTIEAQIERGFAVERVFHGTPSGLDHTVSARGGTLRYRRTEAGLELRPLPLAPLPLVVLDSGAPGDTAALVAGVRARRPGVDPTLQRIGDLVDALTGLLDDPAPDLRIVGALLLENHAMLREIGVCTPDLDALVRLALDGGATGAKLAGAGGGGVVLALAPVPEALLSLARARGVPAFSVLPATPGWEPP